MNTKEQDFKRVKELVSTDMHKLFKHCKDGVVIACNEVHGKRSGRG